MGKHLTSKNVLEVANLGHFSKSFSITLVCQSLGQRFKFIFVRVAVNFVFGNLTISKTNVNENNKTITKFKDLYLKEG